MTYQSAELLNQLAEHGWDVEHIENADSEGPKLEWWADDIWILRSVWSLKIVEPMSHFSLILKLLLRDGEGAKACGL